jgi:hypothetical protein
VSHTSVPDHVRCRLWGRAGGRCQYPGCNRPLWADDVTKAEFNVAYVAHIVADKPGGPRGDPVRSPQLAGELSNLMLLCDPHHRLIDKGDPDGHPEDRLLRMKGEHEDRIVRVTGVARDHRSEVLLYGANIGDKVKLPTFRQAAEAMLPEWYPARDRAAELSLVNSWKKDSEKDYWAIEEDNLRRAFQSELRPLVRAAGAHLSVFAIAPQPLLLLLGRLLGDLPEVEVYQLHREPITWNWLGDAEPQQTLIVEPPPAPGSGPPALVLSLSGSVAGERIDAVLPDANIWRVTIPVPNNDYLKTRAQLGEFRERLRRLLDQIKLAHGAGGPLHVFPAAPVAACVELGRIIMPNADLPLRLYEESEGRFRRVLDIPAD